MWPFMKSCLTRTTVASLSSHSKPKGQGCLQWPQRDLLVNLTFRTETRFFMAFSSWKIVSGYSMPSCLLVLPWAAAPVQDAAENMTLTSSCKQVKSHRDIPFASRSKKPWQKGKANILRLESFHLPFCKLVLSFIASTSTEVQLQPAIPKAAEVTSTSDLLIHTLQHITTHPGFSWGGWNTDVVFPLLQGPDCLCFLITEIPFSLHPFIGNTPSEWWGTLLWLFENLLKTGGSNTGSLCLTD